MVVPENLTTYVLKDLPPGQPDQPWSRSMSFSKRPLPGVLPPKKDNGPFQPELLSSPQGCTPPRNPLSSFGETLKNLLHFSRRLLSRQ